MNIIQKTADKADAWQQRYRLPAFIYAVIKKYGDDQAGYQAALLTYYGFLSLFPLLLVLTTVTGILASGNQHIQEAVFRSVNNYFPVLGSQLSDHVHTLHKSGAALVVGILFTLYGARGVADAFRHGVGIIWGIKHPPVEGFPKNILKSLLLIVVGGLGLLLASVAAGVASAAGHGLLFRLLSWAINFFILFWLFSFLLNVSLPKHVPFKDLRAGAATAAIGLLVLQSLGTYLLARQLRGLSALYSNFAIALGLLFWIYLQAQMLYYAIEIASVKSQNAWPRSLTGNRPTKADKAAA